MQIVIDIPERLYEHIQNGLPNYLFVERLIEGVKEGTPLPKGHGRLIDGDELKTSFPPCDNNMNIKIASVRATVDYAPTIVEADKEDSDADN